MHNKNSLKSNDSSSSTRWGALIAGVGLLVIGISMPMIPALSGVGGMPAGAVFTKVGIVFVCLWLAWPAVEGIRNSVGGTPVLICFGFAFLLFIYRPKTVLITGPFLLIAIAIAVGRNWISRIVK